MTRPQWNEKLRVMFCHVPKCAGHSVRSVLLRPLADKPRCGHWTAMQFREWKPYLFDECFVFGFVRDPVERLISMYRYLLMKRRRPRQLALAARAARDFETFWRTEFTADGVEKWDALKPASHFLCDEDGRFMVDFVGHTKRFDTHFRHVCKMVGVEPIYHQHNASEGEWSIGTYDPRPLRNRIRQLWPLDYEITYGAFSDKPFKRYDYVYK